MTPASHMVPGNLRIESFQIYFSQAVFFLNGLVHLSQTWFFLQRIISGDINEDEFMPRVKFTDYESIVSMVGRVANAKVLVWFAGEETIFSSPKNVFLPFCEFVGDEVCLQDPEATIHHSAVTKERCVLLMIKGEGFRELCLDRLEAERQAREEFMERWMPGVPAAMFQQMELPKGHIMAKKGEKNLVCYWVYIISLFFGGAPGGAKKKTSHQVR